MSESRHFSAVMAKLADGSFYTRVLRLGTASDAMEVMSRLGEVANVVSVGVVIASTNKAVFVDRRFERTGHLGQFSEFTILSTVSRIARRLDKRNARVVPNNLALHDRTLKGLPRLWELLPAILPEQVRIRSYEPAHNDMLWWYASTRRYRGKWARRWLAFAFTVRTLTTVIDCLRVWGISSFFRAILPERMRRYFGL